MNLCENFISNSQDLVNIACGSFTEHRERIKKFRETGNLTRLFRN